MQSTKLMTAGEGGIITTSDGSVINVEIGEVEPDVFRVTTAGGPDYVPVPERPPNFTLERWIERFDRIHEETDGIPADDTSSRYLRNPRFWDEERKIQPGKVVGWILSEEEHGGRGDGRWRLRGGLDRQLRHRR